MKHEAWAWKDKDGKSIVATFVDAFPATYCTITVIDKNRKITHYHGGTVYNLKDRFNVRTGKFNAFGCALLQVWKVNFFSSKINFNVSWKDYHDYWTHFLSALMDGKVIEPDDLNNPSLF